MSVSVYDFVSYWKWVKYKVSVNRLVHVGHLKDKVLSSFGLMNKCNLNILHDFHCTSQTVYKKHSHPPLSDIMNDLECKCLREI